jgi:hypothetical protein
MTRQVILLKTASSTNWPDGLSTNTVAVESGLVRFIARLLVLYDTHYFE